MARSPLFGRRIHISGSIAKDLTTASTVDVEAARTLVTGLVKELVRRGANFVIPVDAEPVREGDGKPICFDWLVWKAVKDNLAHRPPNVPGPFVVAVQHHKTEEQIPDAHAGLWDELRSSQLIKIESAAQWNMNSKRMEAQARFGDVLIALGGDEGVLVHHRGRKSGQERRNPVTVVDLGLAVPENLARLAADRARLVVVRIVALVAGMNENALEAELADRALGLLDEGRPAAGQDGRE